VRASAGEKTEHLLALREADERPDAWIEPRAIQEQRARSRIVLRFQRNSPLLEQLGRRAHVGARLGAFLRRQTGRLRASGHWQRHRREDERGAQDE
jgi:hypothetical protein